MPAAQLRSRYEPLFSLGYSRLGTPVLRPDFFGYLQALLTLPADGLQKSAFSTVTRVPFQLNGLKGRTALEYPGSVWTSMG